jgi:hypothetical protein
MVGVMKRVLILLLLILFAQPAFADDYAGIEAKQYKLHLSMITKIYDDTHKKFGYETRVSTWLSVCGQDELSKATSPDSLALDKFIKTKLDDQNMSGKMLTDMERLRAMLAIKSMYLGYTIGFKEATFNHFEDLSRAEKDASINAAINTAYKILEKK